MHFLVLLEGIASKLVLVYNFLFSLVKLFFASLEVDHEERCFDKIDEKF